MPAPRPAEVVARARFLVETTTRPLDDIAAEIGVCTATLRNWIKRHKWRRPPGAERVPKLPPEKRAAAQRVFENRASAFDLALLLGCDTSYVYHVARQHRWVRCAPAAQRAPDPTPSAAMTKIQEALRDPALTPKDFFRLSERAIALAVADALGGDTAATVAALASLTRSARQMHDLREREGRSEHDAGDAEFASADELRDELARRLDRLRGAEQA